MKNELATIREALEKAQKQVMHSIARIKIDQALAALDRMEERLEAAIKAVKGEWW